MARKKQKGSNSKNGHRRTAEQVQTAARTEHKILYLSLDEMKMMLELLNVSDPFHPLVRKLEDGIRRFTDAVERLRELQARLTANSFWENDGHLQPVRERLHRLKGEYKEFRARKKEEVAHSPPEVVKALLTGNPVEVRLAESQIEGVTLVPAGADAMREEIEFTVGGGKAKGKRGRKSKPLKGGLDP